MFHNNEKLKFNIRFNRQKVGRRHPCKKQFRLCMTSEINALHLVKKGVQSLKIGQAFNPGYSLRQKRNTVMNAMTFLA